MNKNPRFAILSNLKNQLQAHQIYPRVKSTVNMKIFMESHVFAVWDFMLLLKSLQRKLTNVNRIWVPPRNINTARFINEIVVGEQSDVDPSGHGYLSHYQLYVQSMREVGADTSVIEDFVSKVSAGSDPIASLNNPRIPAHVRSFVSNTINAVDQSTPYVAAQFFYGREDPIPQMFQKFVNTLEGNQNCDNLRYYLKRHIEVDGNQHGPLAQKIIQDIADQQDKNYDKILDGAINAVQNRIQLWDGICKHLQ